MLRFDLPLVWSHAIRVDALITFVCCLLALVLTPWILLVPLVLGALRGFVGHQACWMHQAISKQLQAKGWAGKKEDVGAKMFAAKILFVASTAALVLHLNASPLWQIPTTALIVFSFLEWAFGFCAGCRVYGLWYRVFPPPAP